MASESHPQQRQLEAAQKTALAAVRATAMGLVPAGESLEPGDRGTVRRVLEYAQRAGIGRGLVKEIAAAYDLEELTMLLDELNEALAASPVPETEWPAVERVLGTEQLSSLLGISLSSLRRYAAGTRETPDAVAARLHFLALVIGDLAGSYNDAGVRRWFVRKRAQLGGRAPADLLQGDWDPDDAGPAEVRALSRALLGSVAT